MGAIQNRCPVFVIIIFLHGLQCNAVIVEFPILMITFFAVCAHPLITYLYDSQISNPSTKHFSGISSCDFHVCREIGLAFSMFRNRHFCANNKIQSFKLYTTTLIIQAYISLIIHIIDTARIVILCALAACIIFAANFSPT